MALKEPNGAATAVKYCADAVTQMELAARGYPSPDDLSDDLIDRHAWLADAYLVSGDLTKARAQRLTEESMLKKRIAADPKNRDLKDSWIVLQRAFAKLEAREGNTDPAEARYRQALAAVDEMISYDKSNNEWIKLRSEIGDELAFLKKAKTGKEKINGK
jgi:tetratricopeptide (TPR) repeat protein